MQVLTGVNAWFSLVATSMWLQVKEAESRAKEAEAKLKTVEEQMVKKDELLSAVEEEIERIKGEPIGLLRHCLVFARANRPFV